MFIDNKLVTARVEDEENLVNLVLNISSRSSVSNSNSSNQSNPLPDIDISPNLPTDNFNPNPVNGIVKPHYPGRNVGGTEVPMEMKVAAGLLSQFDTIKNVASSLGLNVNTVAQAKHGQTTHGKDNPELKEKLDESLSRVRDKALERLLASLDLLDDVKISKASARDIASISGNMAKVMSSTLPKESSVNVNAQLIVYAPTQVNESRFDVVEI